MDFRIYFEKDLRKFEECVDIYNMLRENKFIIGKEEIEIMEEYRQ